MVRYTFIFGALALTSKVSCAAFDNMGPAAFMWPPDRVWSADADNTAPCGSAAGPANRTRFPMKGGKVALVAQDESYDVELSISHSEDPKSNSDFTTLVSPQTFREMDLGHTCLPIGDAPSSVKAGSNATLQIKYIADFDKPENQTFYACADISYVANLQEMGEASAMCFNATQPGDDSDQDNSGKGKDKDTPQPSKKKSGLSGGAIAGIVIGCLVGVALIAAGAVFVRRRKQRRLAVLRQQRGRGVKWDRQDDDATSRGSVGMNNL